MPSKAPANPATPALTVNAKTFRRPTLSPTKEAAAGFDLPAFHALPYLLFRTFWIIQSMIKVAKPAIQ
jgi:hypothetical protein